MPTYEYECSECRYKFDIFQSIKEEPKKICPKCKKPKLKRLIGRGAGIIFKGTGFYQTDYRSESYKKKVAEEKKLSSSSRETKSQKESRSSSKK